MNRTNIVIIGALAIAASPLVEIAVNASSHRESPAILQDPAADLTDFFAFRSYDSGKRSCVTFIVNFNPRDALAEKSHVPPVGKDVSYQIHIDNNGDLVADIGFDFRAGFGAAPPPITVGEGSDARQVHPVFGDLRVRQAISYSVDVLRPNVDPAPVINTAVSSADFDYESTLALLEEAGWKTAVKDAVHTAQIPGCQEAAHVFAGTVEDPFFMDLGSVFDTLNFDPRTNTGGMSSLANRHVSAFAIEVPTECLTSPGNTVIGAWATSHRPRTQIRNGPGSEFPVQNTGDLIQIQRLGMPLVNEIVIGLPDKDRFNASDPAGDSDFARYFSHPFFPLFMGVTLKLDPPTNLPRDDFFAFHLTGLPGLNQTGGVAGDALRLDTSIEPLPPGDQSPFGFFGGDNAGFPNGRRPGDDVVDIELRVAMGALCHQLPGTFCTALDAPLGLLPLGDGVPVDAGSFMDTFPYLKLPGAGGKNVPPPGGGSPSGPLSLQATLSGGQVVPPTNSTADGTCTGLLGTDDRVQIECQHNVPNVFQGQLRQGASGSNGPLICIDAFGPIPIRWNCELNQTQAAAARAGNTYVNLLSSQFPNGEVRGQIRIVDVP